MMKAFKYRLFPDLKQSSILEQSFGSVRFVYNKTLEFQKLNYNNGNKYISKFNLMQTFLKDLKNEYGWLSIPPSQSLQQSIHHLDNAYKKFFMKTSGFPKFKSKYNKQSISLPQKVKVDFKSNKIQIPKLGKVLAVLHRRFNGKIKTCTVSKNTANQYFISILVDDGKQISNKTKNISKSIGIDLGIKSFIVDSDGRSTENPKFQKHELNKIKKLNRKLSRQKKGSNNRYKTKLKLAKVHNNITNRRNDFLHKLSKEIINNNQVIIIEDLDIKNMLSNGHKHLSRSISDASWYKFSTFLKYKAEWYGKHLVQIDRYEPSSKKCSNCGYINDKLQLSDREWKCIKCNSEHNRDKNAAINIKNAGNKILKNLFRKK